ncbi:bifunctional DNA-formamidopyrimidine glycosylase/DNA-(apurinic or apyrimidinic site) lyase [Amylibacter sp. SFDW26]|uniref:bifunctional DNA-formamidopyrimidine glycosylase/DNA-(apurinic or apyrimidinic site) lyase n=1 Tax=Amylibacter sp. SFDW26 TaxID=2652722 RepID=UPI001261BF48|nr:bifunctional DNA-formamidopyrimidine glycosylase/DNA-(apurinic or apyrimidinic site) lyase [Amylibacter sp. SFDW26]KAB7614417.1 bifunctional DNA-formamidopyrimidine glycosylase/DNA-(apurinic or apyrimidinic site) lyase [Amylibacter sp. SFDW26]
MPELPEVETVRKGLEPHMTGFVIAQADIRRPDLRWPFPENMSERLTGKRVERLRRRSKYVLCDLDSEETLLIHLGMSGRMTISAPDGAKDMVGDFHHLHPAIEKHDHVVLDMDNGARITFNDARRFGAMDLLDTKTAEDHKLLSGIGPEPLGNSFDEAYLENALSGRKMPIKSALLDQKIVAGLGNIYVCETLWRTGISPLNIAGNLSKRCVWKMVPAIRDVLSEAIAAGGSSLKDYRQADGELGYFQHSFSVYGREGKDCRKENCGGTIKRVVQSGRSSFYCPKCQKLKK